MHARVGARWIARSSLRSPPGGGPVWVKAAGAGWRPCHRAGAMAIRGLCSSKDQFPESRLFGDLRRCFPVPKKRSIRSLPLSVKHKHEFVLNRRGMALYMQEYLPAQEEPVGFVFLVHDYASDSSWFLRDLAVVLVEQGFGVYTLDYEGHGKSDGLLAQISSMQEAVNDLVDHFGARNLEKHDKKCFLLGEGLGAALALKAYINQGAVRIWDGLLMVSPTLAFPPRFKPWPMLTTFLRKYQRKLRQIPLVPLPHLAIHRLREPNKRQDLLENPMLPPHNMRVGTTLQLLDLFEELPTHFQDLRIPLMVLHGEEDELNDKEVSKLLYTKAKSIDKTYKTYDGMQHSLLGGQPDEQVAKVQDDIIGWLRDRVDEHPDDDEEEEEERDELGAEVNELGEGRRVHSVRSIARAQAALASTSKKAKV